MARVIKITFQLRRGLHDKWIEEKVNLADCGDIISHNASEFAVANHNHKIEDLTQTDYIIFNCGSSSTVI